MLLSRKSLQNPLYTKLRCLKSTGLDGVPKIIASSSVGHQFEILCNEVHGEGIHLEKVACLQLVKISLYLWNLNVHVYLQKLATGPYPDLNDSNSCPPILHFV
jgi:hypothetical protein